MPNSEYAWKVFDTAMAHRAAFNMDRWVEFRERRWKDGGATLEELESECGTTACLASWAVAMDGYELDEGCCRKIGDTDRYAWTDIQATARGLFGITYSQSHRLFLEVGNEDVEQEMISIFGPRPADAAVTA